MSGPRETGEPQHHRLNLRLSEPQPVPQPLVQPVQAELGDELEAADRDRHRQLSRDQEYQSRRGHRGQNPQDTALVTDRVWVSRYITASPPTLRSQTAVG